MRALVFFTALSATIVADAVVFIVIWRQTYHVVRLALREKAFASLSTVILRDGSYPLFARRIKVRTDYLILRIYLLHVC